MSEQVSLDFLISLKQANQNKEETRKVGGILDYFATMAKRANDALFNTSQGKNAVKEHAKATSQISKGAIAASAATALAGKAASVATSMIVKGVKTSLGWWIEHHGAMTKFRKELGLTQQETHQLTMGVSRASAQYGTSLRTVREIAFFMSKGAKVGQKDIENLSASLANLVEYGGASVEATTEFIQAQTTMYGAQGMTEEKATKTLWALKAMSAERKASVEPVIKALAELKEMYPFMENADQAMTKRLGTMMIHMEANRESASLLSGYMGNLNQKSKELLYSSQGDLDTFFGTIFVQFDDLQERLKSDDKEVRANARKSYEMQLERYGLSANQATQIFKVWKSSQGEMAKTDAMFNKSQKALENVVESHTTAMERLHKKMMTIKSEAGNLWESWLGGENGKRLLAYLNEALTRVAETISWVNKVTGGRDLTGPAPGSGKRALDTQLQEEAIGGKWNAVLGAFTGTRVSEQGRKFREGLGTPEEQAARHRGEQSMRSDFIKFTQGTQMPTNYMVPHRYLQEGGWSDKAMRALATRKEDMQRNYEATGNREFLDRIQILIDLMEKGNKERERQGRPSFGVGNAARQNQRN